MSKASSLPTVTLWGRRCPQTAVTLSTLLAAGIAVRCLVVAQPGTLGVHTTSTVPTLAPWRSDPVSIAYSNAVPVLALHRKTELERALDARDVRADCGVVSCFPWLLPARLLQHYPLGMLNIHPSLLPAYRGPSPLFWQYRDGRLETGVTVHVVTEELDAGPIVRQVRCTLPLGFPGDRLEAWLAWYGTLVLIDVLKQSPPVIAQQGAASPPSWARLPTRDDSTVDTSWPAWRIAHFLAGVLPLGFVVFVDLPTLGTWRIDRLVAWTANPPEPAFDGRRLTFHARGGWITVDVSPAQPAERVRRSTLRQ